MSRAFPEFVEEEGSGKITLSNPERYRKLDSGIFYEDVHSTTKGNHINSPKQLVTITYSYLTKDAKLLHNKRFNSSLAEFANEFTCTADITEAVNGMHVTGQRRIIILPEIHKNGECRVVDVAVLKIKNEKQKIAEEEEILERKDKADEKAERDEEKGKVDQNEILKYIIDKVDVSAVLRGVATICGGGSALVIHGMISRLSNTGVISKDPEAFLQKPRLDEKTRYSAQNAYISETKPQTNFHTDEQQTVHPARNPHNYGIEPKPKPKEWGGIGPKITYKVMNEGEGEGITRYRQACFEYNLAGSMEAIIFNGSPTELAIKLFPGFEDAMLEAILGMKHNGRRIIFIPVEVSGLGEETVLDLKLTALNPWSRM